MRVTCLLTVHLQKSCESSFPEDVAESDARSKCDCISCEYGGNILSYSSGSDQLFLHFCAESASMLPCGGRDFRNVIQSDCFVGHDPQVSSVSDVLNNSCG